MTSRPSNLLSRLPGVVAPTFMVRRLGAASRQRNPAARYVARGKKRYVQTPATIDGAIVATGALALPAVYRVHDGNSRWCERGIEAWVSYAGRLLTFNVAVAIIHLTIVRWIFLPIGG